LYSYVYKHQDRVVTAVVLIFSICLLQLSGCSDRERSNPLDPGNPLTGGKPSNVEIIASSDSVRITWDSMQLRDLTEYKVNRRMATQSNFATIATLPKTTNSYTDKLVQADREYIYNIVAVGTTYESPPSDSVRVSPGPTFTWVSDNNSGNIVKLSHDSRRQVLRKLREINITEIEPNRTKGVVWVIDQQFQQGYVARLSLSGDFIEPLYLFSQPVDIAVVRQTGDLWVADSKDNIVVHYDASGLEDGRYSISQPRVVAVDQRNGTCWTINSSDNSVVWIIPDSNRVRRSGVQLGELRSLDVDSRSGAAWVIERHRAIKLSEDGQYVTATSSVFADASKIAVNNTTGEFWVLDSGNDSVSRFGEDGSLHFEVSDFSAPQDIAVNPTNGNCLVADTNNNRVVRISPRAQVFDGYAILDNPSAVAVEY